MYKSKLIQLLLGCALGLPLLASAEESMLPEGGHPPFAGPRGDMHEGPRGGMPGAHLGAPGLPMLRGLELSDSQEDKIFQLVHDQAPYVREQQRAHEKAMRALHEMRNADKFDDAAASRLAQAAAQAQANLLLAHIRTQQKVLALLTPEQRKQLEERKTHPQRGGFNER